MSPPANARLPRKLSRGRRKQSDAATIRPGSGLRGGEDRIEFLQRGLGNAGFARLVTDRGLAVERAASARAPRDRGTGSVRRQGETGSKPPSLLGTGPQLTLDPEIEAQMRAMQALRLTLNPTQLRPNLLQVPGSFARSPGPFDFPSLPQPEPLVPAGEGPAAPRAAEASDLLEAVMSVPAIDTAIESLRTQALEKVSSDFGNLSTGGKAATVSALAVIAGGSLAGAMTDPEARKFALDQLNGRVLPVPGVSGLGLELNTKGENIMVGLHLDVGRLLPASFGFGPSSPEAIGGPPIGRKAIEPESGSTGPGAEEARGRAEGSQGLETQGRTRGAVPAQPVSTGLRIDRAASDLRQRLIDRAVETNDIGDIKFLNEWGGRTDAFRGLSVPQRIKFIQSMLDQRWVGPSDEGCIENIWDSFDSQLAAVANEHSKLWRDSLDRGVDPSEIGSVSYLRDAFKSDVKGLSKKYMELNKQFAQEELEKFGFMPSFHDVMLSGLGPSPTKETEEDVHLEKTRQLARIAADALKAQDLMKTIFVGYRSEYKTMRGDSFEWVKPQTFDPEKPPRYEEYLSWPKPQQSWQKVKEAWDASNDLIKEVSASSPTLFAALGQGREKAEGLAADDPKVARQVAQDVLNTLYSNTLKTIPKLESGELDWRDLKPIHNQLYSGKAKGASGVDWSKDFAKSIAEDVIGDHETAEFWKTLGLASLQAALFIVAEIATGGLATVALVGAIGIGAGQAVAAWDNYDKLSTAAHAAASEQTQVVSPEQAKAARFEAILNTIFAVIDVGSVAFKGGRALYAGLKLGERVAERSAEAALKKIGTLEARQAAEAVERGIAEVGVQKTAQTSGKSLDELAQILRAHPDLPGAEAALKRLEQAKALGIGAGEAGLKSTEMAAAAAGTAAEETWKGTRSLGELIRDIPGALAEKKISAKFADQLMAEAIEKAGPVEVIRAAGGWKKLAKILPEESEAAKRLLRWRDAVFEDLDGYMRELQKGVPEELKSEMKAPGSRGKMTNDIDASFTGAKAAETRREAAAYLAKKLGISDSNQGLEFFFDAALHTDPRRMHIYDWLSAEVRDRVAKRQAATEEALIWNRRLYEAVKGGEEDLAKALRKQMQDQGIAEFAYKPLSTADRDALARVVDRMHQDFAKATDDATREALAERIANAQALINHSEGGGYFTGGGVRQWVSERSGQAAESQFARPKGAEGLAVPTAEKLGNALDQFSKLDHALGQLGEGGLHAVDGVRGIGKYGRRLAETLENLGAYEAKAWEKLLKDCDRLKKAADAGEIAKQFGVGQAEAVIGEARRLFDDLIAKSWEGIQQLRGAAGIQPIGDAAAKLQAATLAHVRLMRAADLTIQNLWALIRPPAQAAASASGASSE